jgi:hypothetical protein
LYITIAPPISTNTEELIMNAPEQPASQSDIEQRMKDTLEMQRADYLKEGVVTAETRIDRLRRGGPTATVIATVIGTVLTGRTLT